MKSHLCMMIYVQWFPQVDVELVLFCSLEIWSVLTLWTSWENYCFLEGLLNYPLKAKCNKSYVTLKPSINQWALQAWQFSSSECPASLRQYSLSSFHSPEPQVINSCYSAAVFTFQPLCSSSEFAVTPTCPCAFWLKFKFCFPVRWRQYIHTDKGKIFSTSLWKLYII